MTYNVHRCRGTDGRVAPERIAEVVASCQPDIVALQELDVRRARTGKVDQAQVVADALKMNVRFHPAFRVMDELYGDAILTALPMRAIKAGPLPERPRAPITEPRGALWVAVTCGGHELQVINTHLGLDGRERLRQIDTLVGEEWLGHPDCADPAVFLGDLNALPGSRVWRRLSPRMRDAQRSWNQRRTKATFPSWLPCMRIDHAFVSGSIEVIGSHVLRTKLTRLASDHLPLVVDIRIPPPAR